MLSALVTLLAALVGAPTPGGLDPNTGMVTDPRVQPAPPPPDPRNTPTVNFNPSPTAPATTPTSTPPSTGPTTGRGVPLRPRPLPTDLPPAPGPSEQPPLPPGAELRGDPRELYPLSFAVEELELSQVLKTALETNIDLRSTAIDIAITEKQLMAALGAYDVFLTANATALKQVAPQRGSQFALFVGQKTLSGSFGFDRKLESGGQINLTFLTSRTSTIQPINIANAGAGTRLLTTYLIAPTLTFNHPLLRNAGVRVNRADIDRARIARSQMEANEQQIAQQAVRDLILAYWDLLFASRDLDNKRRSAATTQEQHRRVKAEVSAGRKSQLDLDTITQTLIARENEVVLAENLLLDRSLTLRTLMGQTFEDRKVLGIIPKTDPQALAARDFDLQAEIKKALAANPQLRALEISISSRRIDELVAANQRLPQLDFRFIFTPQGRSIDFAAVPEAGLPAKRATWSEVFKNFFNATDGATDISSGLFADFTMRGELNFSFDIQGRAPKANHERVVLEIQKAELNFQKSRQQISVAVIRAVNAMRNASARMTITSESVRLAESNLRAEEARYRVGRSTSYDVLFRQDELALAQFNALNAQIDYLRATVELQNLTGQILPAYGLDLVGGRAARQSGRQ